MPKIRYFPIAFIYLFIYFIIQEPLSYSHWWQTLMQEEQEGEVVLTCFEKERAASGFTAFTMCLDGIENTPSLKVETKRRHKIPYNDNTNKDFMNYQTVWKILEKQNIGDTLSAKWVVSRKDKIIFTSLDNNKDIGKTDDIMDKIHNGMQYFAALISLIAIFFVVTAPKQSQNLE